MRYTGYWAEGLVTVSSPPGGVLGRAEDTLKAMLPTTCAGTASSDLLQAAALLSAPCKFHSLVQTSIGSGIDLSFEGTPILTPAENLALEEAGVRIAATPASRDGAKSGGTETNLVLDATGDPSPSCRFDVRAKFHRLADPVIGKSAARELEEACLVATEQDHALAKLCDKMNP